MTVYLPGPAQPDRIKQFGAVRREPEGRRRDVPYKPGMGLDTLGAQRVQEIEREPPARPRVAFQSPILDYTLGHVGNTTATGNGGIVAFSENFHKDVSGTIGEIVAPRCPL